MGTTCSSSKAHVYQGDPEKAPSTSPSLSELSMPRLNTSWHAQKSPRRTKLHPSTPYRWSSPRFQEGNRSFQSHPPICIAQSSLITPSLSHPLYSCIGPANVRSAPQSNLCTKRSWSHPESSPPLTLNSRNLSNYHHTLFTCIEANSRIHLTR